MMLRLTVGGAGAEGPGLSFVIVRHLPDTWHRRLRITQQGHITHGHTIMLAGTAAAAVTITMATTIVDKGIVS